VHVVVVGILALILTFTAPPYPWLRGPFATLGAAAAVTLIPAAAAWLLNRRVLRLFDEHAAMPSRAQAALGRGMAVIQGVLGVGHGALLLTTDWLELCYRLPVVGTWPAVPGLAALAPFLLTLVLVWSALYPSDRAVRQIAFELHLLRGQPLRPVWSRWQHLIYSLRHQVLFVLVPMALILAARDTVYAYEEPLRRLTRVPYAGDLLIGAVALLVAVIAPALLRRIWVTQRLPDGPLRDRLLALCDRLRLRCREILVWRSGGMVVNAAVMGVVPRWRYVLITDGMLEQLDDTKIEAVFGHEAGHVQERHIPYYLLFALLSGCLVAVFSTAARALPREQYEWALAALGVLLLVKWGVVFGWISRRFERQADVCGVRALTLSGLPCDQPCALHPPSTDRPPEPGALCAAAAHVFSDALHDVAALNGMSAEARSWRHSSIASRSRFIQRLALRPAEVRAFERAVRRVKLAIAVAAAGSAAWAAQALGVWAALRAWIG